MYDKDKCLIQGLIVDTHGTVKVGRIIIPPSEIDDVNTGVIFTKILPINMVVQVVRSRVIQGFRQLNELDKK